MYFEKHAYCINMVFKIKQIFLEKKNQLYCSHSQILRGDSKVCKHFLYSVNIQLCLWVEIRSYSCVLFVYSSIHYQLLFLLHQIQFSHTLCYASAGLENSRILFLLEKKSVLVSKENQVLLDLEVPQCWLFFFPFYQWYCLYLRHLSDT